MWIPDCPKIQEAYRLGMLQVPEEMEFMCAFLAWKRPKVILEIGACYGASMMLWCQYAQPELAISLDSGVAKDGRADVNLEKRAELFKSLKVIELLADSHTMAAVEMTINALGGRKVDMLVIDGDHSYEGVFADFLMYRKFLNENGFVLFHDVLRSEYHDNLDCAAAHIYRRIKAKIKVTVIGNGNGGGGWGIWYPWGGQFLPNEEYAQKEEPKTEPVGPAPVQATQPVDSPKPEQVGPVLVATPDAGPPNNQQSRDPVAGGEGAGKPDGASDAVVP